MKLGGQAKKDVLKTALVLSGLRSKSVSMLAFRTEERHASPLEVIVEQGGTGGGMVIIKSGEVVVSRVINLRNPVGLVSFGQARPVNPETETEIKLAKMLPENALGRTGDSAFPFRLTAGNKPVLYYFVSSAVLKETLDSTELSRVRSYLDERMAEFSGYLTRNVYFRQIVDNTSQPDFMGKRINFCRKPIFPSPFRLPTTESLPKIPTKTVEMTMKGTSRLDLLPLDFMSRHKGSSQSQKQIRIDSINIGLVRKSIEKLRLLAKNPHQQLKSRFLDFRNDLHLGRKSYAIF